MANDVPGEKDARYRLLGLQAVPHDDGVIIRRGTASVFVRGERARDLLDILIARSAEGRGIVLDEIKAETDLASHPTLTNLIETLRAERLLVVTERVTGPPRAERREEVFYWSHGASHAEATANVADVALAIFGVNHIALALFGNLRSCGFRNLTFIDHPALRNLDFFEGNAIRSEIASALSVRPQAFDEWSNAPARPDCHVVCSDFGGLGLMREWNRNAVAANMLFYPIVLQDEIAHLGPLVVPGEGPASSACGRARTPISRTRSVSARARCTPSSASMSQATSSPWRAPLPTSRPSTCSSISAARCRAAAPAA